MIDKFDFYDVMSTLVPGVMVVGLVGALFPEYRDKLITDYSGAFVVIALTALAVFIGQLLVAIGSMIECVLFWTWGGKPSNKALELGLGERYLPKSKAMRIKAKISTKTEECATTASLFLKAMTLARGTGNGLVEKFNALYAYHRTLLVLMVVALGLVIFSRIDGICREIEAWRFVTILAIISAVMAIFWYRTKQRAYYFVREVLLMAEQQIDSHMKINSET